MRIASSSGIAPAAALSMRRDARHDSLPTSSPGRLILSGTPRRASQFGVQSSPLIHSDPNPSKRLEFAGAGGSAGAHRAGSVLGSPAHNSAPAPKTNGIHRPVAKARIEVIPVPALPKAPPPAEKRPITTRASPVEAQKKVVKRGLVAAKPVSTKPFNFDNDIDGTDDEEASTVEDIRDERRLSAGSAMYSMFEDEPEEQIDDDSHIEETDDDEEGATATAATVPSPVRPTKTTKSKTAPIPDFESEDEEDDEPLMPTIFTKKSTKSVPTKSKKAPIPDFESEDEDGEPLLPTKFTKKSTKSIPTKPSAPKPNKAVPVPLPHQSTMVLESEDEPEVSPATTKRGPKPASPKKTLKKAPAPQIAIDEDMEEAEEMEENAVVQAGKGRNGTTKKIPVKKAPAKKAPVKKAPVKKPSVKKAPAKVPS